MNPGFLLELAQGAGLERRIHGIRDVSALSDSRLNVRRTDP